MVKIPRDVEDAMKILEEAGYKVYLVGGAPRDLLLGLEPTDYDLTTSARPREVLEVFEKHGWKTIPKGIEYGVVSVLHPETRREIEVSTFRKEFYPELGNRRKVDIEYADTVEEDLARRDFTINALAMDRSGRVVDPYGGRRDMSKKIIRFVGDPYERIREDPLRMFRALRFASRFGYTIDPTSIEAIKDMHWMARYLSRERIGEEVLKAAKTPRFADFVELLLETGLYKFVLPELEIAKYVAHSEHGSHRGETVLEHILSALRRADELGATPELKLAILLHDIGKPLVADSHRGESFISHERASEQIARKTILERLRLPRKIADTVSSIIKYHHVAFNLWKSGKKDKEIVSRLVSKYGPELAKYILLHSYLDSGDKYFLSLAEKLEKELGKPKPLITGHDIMEVLGIPPGPQVGKIKQEIYEEQLRRGIRSKRELLELLKRKYRRKKNLRTLSL